MKPITCLLLVFLSGFPSARAADPSIDDAGIRKSFLEQILVLRKEGLGLNAATLRRELGKEKRGVDGLSLPQRSSAALSPAELYNERRDSTLIIGHVYLDESSNDWKTNLAGGVVITPDGVAVTNYHVLDYDRATNFAAMNHAGTLFPITKVLASDRRADLAVIQLDSPPDLEAAPLTVESKVGDSIAVISHPDAHFFTFTPGTISRFSVDPGTRARRIEVTAPFARGSSGSGIFDRSGNIAGIVSGTNAIYYEEDGRARRNLQMVIHSGVPASSLLRLLSGE